MSTPASSLPRDTFVVTSCLPEFGNAMLAGRLIVGATRIRFESDRGVVEWPIDEVELSLGGHNDRHLFLFRRGAPTATLNLSDLALLDHPAFERHKQLREKTSRMRRQAGRIPRSLIAAAVVLFALLAGLVAVVVQKERIVHSLARNIPVEWEQEFGRSIYEKVVKEQKLLTNSAVFEAQVRAVTNALLPVIAREGREFQFHIVEDTNINAFAVPGGHVFIHTGLLASARKPEELAGVLAHEIAHVTQRHGFRNLMESAGLWFLVSSVFGDVEGVTAVLVQGSQFLLNQKFSRDFEREADDVGWGYLVAANINPRGMIDFFETLKAEEGKLASSKAAQSLDLMSTHPATTERMERLEAKWKKLGKTTGYRELK